MFPSSATIVPLAWRLLEAEEIFLSYPRTVPDGCRQWMIGGGLAIGPCVQLRVYAAVTVLLLADIDLTQNFLPISLLI